MARVFIPGFRKIEVSGGGEVGTTNYNDLTNKPSINNVPLVGNLNTANLKLTDATLTEEGVPAEAKTVGAKLAEQSTSLLTLKEQLGNHTVKSDVPENAVFTDTVYDDTEVKEEFTKVDNKLTTNLLKPTLGTVTQNGVTCTNNGDGTYTLNGTASADADVEFVLYGSSNLVELNKEFRLTGCPNNTGAYLFVGDWGIPWTLYGKDIGNGSNFKITTSSPDKRIVIVVTKGITVDNLVFKPMITTNLNATYDDFVPYTGSTGQINSDVASLLKRIETLESLVNKTDTTTTE